MAGRYEIRERMNGEFQFNLKAGNGQTILSSEGYASKDSCRAGIESVRAASPIVDRYQRLMARDGSPYFNLVASNGAVIGSSEMYSSIPAREKGIESVQTNAPSAVVRDTTA